MNTQLRVLEELLRAIQREHSLVDSERTSAATDVSLEAAAFLCRDAISALRDGQGPVAADMLQRVARMAVDEWALGSPLTARVTECAQLMGR